MKTTTSDDNNLAQNQAPGFQLGLLREKKGFTKEYVAAKLHLRVKIIDLLEGDDYSQMPESVFIMGYFRAYAKLLGVAPEPFIEVYNTMYNQNKKPEKALWQSKRESNKNELIIRLLTGLVAVAAMLALAFWWQKNKDSHMLFPEKQEESIVNSAQQDAKMSLEKDSSVHNNSVELTETAKLESLFASKTSVERAEKPSA